MFLHQLVAIEDRLLLIRCSTATAIDRPADEKMAPNLLLLAFTNERNKIEKSIFDHMISLRHALCSVADSKDDKDVISFADAEAFPQTNSVHFGSSVVTPKDPLVVP